jgi:hypothetical protein
VLYSSNYVVYGQQTNGAYLHSVQNGNVYTGFGGHYNYGCYSSPQTDLDASQFYNLQAQADGNGGSPCGVTGTVAPTTAADYYYVAIQAPGTSATVTSELTPIDISQSTALLIQMGNTKAGSHANVFTVVLNDDTTTAQNSKTATACSYNVTLGTVGPSGNSLFGLLNYNIPLSRFTTCTGGSIANIQSTGVTSVTIKVTGDQNPNVTIGEFDTIAVGYVGFTI